MALTHLYQQINHSEWVDIPTGWLQGRTIFGGLVAGYVDAESRSQHSR